MEATLHLHRLVGGHGSLASGCRAKAAGDRLPLAPRLAAASPNGRVGARRSLRRSSGLPRPVVASASATSAAAAPAVSVSTAPANAEGAAPSLSATRGVPVLPFRVGHGFDLHRLEPGRRLIIGGVDIPHDRGCDAHSDGDVLMHCIVDAILGALGLPDIGQLFPDNDPQWKGAASHVFMTEAVRRMKEAGYHIGNMDSTIILQRPKLSPHKASIKANLCALLEAAPEVINVKAKTHEKVDSLGENRSVACHTVVLLIRNDQSS